jgi:hypothetical protein
MFTGQNRAATTFSSLGEKPPGVVIPAADAPEAAAMPSTSTSDAKLSLPFAMANLLFEAEVASLSEKQCAHNSLVRARR